MPWITSSPPTPRIAAPRICLRLGVDHDLHEALRLALLDGAADARHRRLPTSALRPDLRTSRLGHARRGRAADRCRARRSVMRSLTRRGSSSSRLAATISKSL